MKTNSIDRLSIEDLKLSEIQSRDKRVSKYQEETIEYVGTAYHDLEIENILRASDISDGLRILDAGCGNGRLINIIAKMGVEISACDFSPLSVQFVKNRFPSADCFVQDITKALPYENYFDRIISVQTVQHVHKSQQLIALVNFLNALKPNGRLIATVYNFYPFAVRDIIRFKKPSQQHIFRKYHDEEIMDIGIYQYRFRRSELKQLLSTAGYQRNSIYGNLFFPPFIRRLLKIRFQEFDKSLSMTFPFSFLSGFWLIVAEK
jgi:SAM-dependent methyltransferase